MAATARARLTNGKRPRQIEKGCALADSGTFMIIFLAWSTHACDVSAKHKHNPETFIGKLAGVQIRAATRQIRSHR
jgi:hypothetical protein